MRLWEELIGSTALSMPSLNLNFLTGGILDPRIAFSRGTNAWYYNSTGVLTQTATTASPRFDYNPSTHQLNGLLIEQASTNLALQSNALTNATWDTQGNGGFVITGSAGTSPDGTNNAFSFLGNGVSAQVLNRQVFAKAASNITYTLTVFAKASGVQYFALALKGNGGEFANGMTGNYDLTNGVVSTATTSGTGWSGVSGAITAAGSGWYRLTLTGTSNTATNVNIYSAPANTSGNLIGGTWTIANGQGSLVYGFQLEAASFATSYIPTTTASVTRNADLATIAVTTFPWSPNFSTATVEYIYPSGVNGSSRIIGSGPTPPTPFFINGAGLVTDQLGIYNGNVALIATNGQGAGNVTQKAASTWSAAGMAISVNGSAPTTSTDGSLTDWKGVTSLALGSTPAGLNYVGAIYIRKFGLYNMKASLQQLVQFSRR
jgi:hypothetical protein